MVHPMVVRICEGCAAEIPVDPHVRVRVVRQPGSRRVTIVEGNFILHECVRREALGAA